MRVSVDQETREIYGTCEACGREINFEHYDADADAWGYYTAEDIVNKWMDHQLNDCKPSVIDNAASIG